MNENKRDAVISRRTYQELSGFKEFRNFERHNYLRSIDSKVVIDSVENSFSLLHKPLIAEIETFITKLPLELQPGNEVNFKEKQAAASELNRNQYLHYKAQVSVRKTARTGLVGKIIQQEQEDIAIAQKILAEFPNLNIQAINKIKRIISQGDYAKKLKNTKDKKEINQYLNEIISKAQPMKKTNRSQENTLEQD